MGTLCGHQYTFIIISHSILLKIRNVSNRGCRENNNNNNNNTFTLNNIFKKKKIISYEIMWKNTADPYRPQMTI